MSSRGKLPKAGLRAGAVAAAGLATVSGISAAQAMASTPTGTATSTRIYACYSNSTDQLFYLNYPTDRRCGSGQTRISWNLAGPQGPQGVQGAQGAPGPQGARGPQGRPGQRGVQGAQGASGTGTDPGFTDAKTFSAASRPVIATSPTPVLTFNPTFTTSYLSADFNVDTTVTVQNSNATSTTDACWLRDYFSDSLISSSRSTYASTPITYVTATKGRPATANLTGGLLAAANSGGYAHVSMQAVCKALSGTTVHAVDANMVATQVTSLSPSPHSHGLANRFFTGTHRKRLQPSHSPKR